MNNSFQNYDHEFDPHGSESKESGRSGRWYSAAELYWVMVNYFGLKAKLVWKFIPYAIQLPDSTSEDVNLDACIDLFKYGIVDTKSLSPALMKHVEKHPLP